MSDQISLIPADYVLSARVGTNSDLFASAVKLYVKPGQTVADVTYGKGVFWQGVNTSDYDLRATDLAHDGIDFRNLPYEDASLDALVLDPPYIYNPKDTVKASISQPYNVNTTGLGLTTINAVVKFYCDGMDEAKRVLKPGGRLFVKCQDQIESGKQRWVHLELYGYATTELGMYGRDLLVLVQKSRPAIRWPNQKHARKNHSYLWVFDAREHMNDLRAADLYAKGDLVGAAEKEANACERDGFDITAAIIRDLVTRVQPTEESVNP
jgi:hypothetical protein